MNGTSRAWTACALALMVNGCTDDVPIGRGCGMRPPDRTFATLPRPGGGTCPVGHIDCFSDPICGLDALTNPLRCGVCRLHCLGDPYSTAQCLGGWCERRCRDERADCDCDPATACDTDILERLAPLRRVRSRLCRGRALCGRALCRADPRAPPRAHLRAAPHDGAAVVPLADELRGRRRSAGGLHDAHVRNRRASMGRDGHQLSSASAAFGWGSLLAPHCPSRRGA